MWRGAMLLVILALVSVYGFDTDYNLILQIVNNDPSESKSYVLTVSDEEYIKHLRSMWRARRGGARRGAGKRNADLINSLLALPKGMNDAGR